MRLAEPAWLILLILAPWPWLWERRRRRVSWPTFDGFAKGPRRLAGWPRHLPVLMRCLAVAGMAVAMARPQTVGGRTRVAGRGVAIVVAVDQSTTMNAIDFRAGPETISRLEAARRTLSRFIEGRPDDLIGLVEFANYPDLTCPPTLDHVFLLEKVAQIRTARPGDDGTNLGDALVWSLDAARRCTPSKKVIVLLTDGRNNPAVAEPADPEAAAGWAGRLGITLHTIAVGGAGGLVRANEPITGLPVSGEVGAPDFALLERMAKLGGGRSFEAADAASLERVFRAIDELEKSPVQATIRTRYDERYAPWAGAALALLAIDRLLVGWRFRRLP